MSKEPLHFASMAEERRVLVQMGRRLGILAATLAGLREGKLVAVPREATEAMHNAARDWSDAKYGEPIGIDASAEWAAILAAAQDRTP